MVKKPVTTKTPDKVQDIIESMTRSHIGWFTLGLVIGILAGFFASWLMSNLSLSWTGVVT